jgi:hypothetical protein
MQRSAAFSTNEKRLHQSYLTQQQSGRWLDYPMIVSIETYSKCNARCHFCVYQGLSRIDQHLSEDDVLGLVDQLAEFKIPPQRLNFSRVNEPFLDNRIFDFLRYANKRLPKTALILFTNGQTLLPDTVDRLNAIQNFKQLTISFNESNPDDYREVMGLDQQKTLKRLDHVAARHAAGKLHFKLGLSRVGSSDQRDDAFLAWCHQRFPGLPVSISAKFDWQGHARANNNEKLPPPTLGVCNGFPCTSLPMALQRFVVSTAPV